MAGIKWMSILAVTVAIIGAIQLASAAPVDNSLDDLNPLNFEVRLGLKWVISNSDHSLICRGRRSEFV